MASHIKRGESLFIPFRNDLSISDSQNKPRMYKTVQMFEKAFPKHPFHRDGVELVEYAEVRHGRWVINSELEENPLEPREYDEHFYAVCSECGRTIYLNDYICATGDYKKAVKEYPYCHCGAKMDGGVKE